MAESDQKPAPPPLPGSTYDPGWDSGLSGRLGGQGFMGAPPPRNPPPEPEQGGKGEGDEDFPRDREHLTEADRKGEGEQGEPELAPALRPRSASIFEAPSASVLETSGHSKEQRGLHHRGDHVDERRYGEPFDGR